MRERMKVDRAETQALTPQWRQPRGASDSAGGVLGGGQDGSTSRSASLFGTVDHSLGRSTMTVADALFRMMPNAALDLSCRSFDDSSLADHNPSNFQFRRSPLEYAFTPAAAVALSSLHTTTTFCGASTPQRRQESSAVGV